MTQHDFGAPRDPVSRPAASTNGRRIALALAFLAGCNASGSPGGAQAPNGQGKEGTLAQPTFVGEYPIKVECTTGMVADVVRNVGAEHVAVGQLMGAGVDPHLYKASPGDGARLNAADVIFYSGFHLEGKMTDLFVRMARRKPTFAITESIDETSVLDTADGAHDPHLWFDVRLWSQTALIVRDALSQFDPSHATDYATNADAYRKDLEALDGYARERIGSVAQERRVLITAHDAFEYFGRAYGMQVRGIQGISTESEAGVRAINELVGFLVERKIKAVFVESSVSDRNMKALVEGARARGHEVVIGGELFSDAMGEPGTPEGTYTGMVRHNVDTIVEALK